MEHLIPVWRLLPVAELAHFCEARKRTTLPGAWACRLCESTLSQAHLQKLFYFPRISFPFPFPCPMRRGCLTVSAQETHVLILLNPLTHGEPDGSGVCSVWVCFFIFVLWFNAAFSACCQKGHCQQGPTPTLNALPYISSMNALPHEI